MDTLATINTNSVSKKHLAVIGLSAVTAILLVQPFTITLYIGLLCGLVLLSIAAKDAWSGVLALFPLVFSLDPAPATIGVRESLFVVLLGLVYLGGGIKFWRNTHSWLNYRKCIALAVIGVIFLGTNFLISRNNAVPTADWIRGVVPFVFISICLPIGVLLGGAKEKYRDLCYSIVTLLILMCGTIVAYYFYHGMWRPYWVVTVNNEVLKIFSTTGYPISSLSGPMHDRITTILPQSTDAILPIGMGVGLALCVFARKTIETYLAWTLSLISLFAILITFTRSMLISGLSACLVFAAATAIANPSLRKKIFLSLAGLVLSGIAFVYTTGMQDVWVGRVEFLIQAGSQASKVSAEANAQIAQIQNNDKFVQDASKTKTFNALAKKDTVNTPDKHNSDSEPRTSSEVKKWPIGKINNPGKALVLVLPPYVVDFGSSEEYIPITEEKTKLDFNVSSRVTEYKIAWEKFLDHPLLGSGLGVKHEMRWETSEGASFVEQVAYVHNWILYMLMVGGVTGFCVYAYLLIGPLLIGMSKKQWLSPNWLVIRTAILAMAAYGLFFAVFRMITFNLILGAVWAVVISNMTMAHAKNSTRRTKCY